jgi:hypothetical protein
MSSRIVLAASTLALGTALTAIPALAQDYGSGANNAQQYKYPVGRPMNDGGFAPQSSQNSGQQEQAQYNGGQREERTGSAENNEHAQARSARLGGSGPANYAYDPYGRGRGSYYDYSAASGPAVAGGPMPDAIAACEARFHTYDPATGTYLGFDGIRHNCP